MPLARSVRRLALAAALAPAPLAAQATPDTTCTNCVAWNRPHAPQRVFGNTYYVGTDGLTVLLVTGPDGHVLIDGALEESVPQVLANIAALGFRARDVKLIVNSHAHFDHAGGLAALQRATGAPVAVSARSAAWLRAGGSLADDPQYGTVRGYPAVAQVREVADSAEVRVGALALRAWLTPGHTPGGTTWTWTSCADDGRCAAMVYADSQSPLSAPGFRYLASATYPDGPRDFARAQARWAAMPCDVLVTPHPMGSALFERLAGTKPLVEPGACRAYAEAGRAAWAAREATERGGR